LAEFRLGVFSGKTLSAKLPFQAWLESPEDFNKSRRG